MRTRLWWIGPAALIVSCLVAAQSAPEVQVLSCVPGSAPLHLEGAQATLDPPDTERFHEAAQRLYPLYQRGGLAPSKVLLLHRGGRWVYVTLASPDGRAPCFSAVFAAERFDFTDRWVSKYRPRQGVVED